MKWNLAPDLKLVRFKPSKRVNAANGKDMMAALLSSPEVCGALQTPIVPSQEQAAEIPVEALACTVLNMNFFDVLQEDNEVVTDNGASGERRAERAASGASGERSER